MDDQLLASFGNVSYSSSSHSMDESFKYPLLQTLMYDQPLAIHPSKADVMHQVLQGYVTGQHPVIQGASEFMQAADHKPYQVTKGGVAVIPVMGALTHRGGWLDAMSGLTSYQRVTRMLRTAVNDSDAKGILLEVDSPGGSVSGLFSGLVSDIEAINAKKPVWALANESMFSAAYAIGASTARIIAPKTATVGSIGVIMMHLDNSKANEMEGRKYTAIYAGDHKTDGSPHAELSDQAFNTYQNLVNDSYDIFVAHVAMGRAGMDEAAVRDTEANIFNAKQALDIGLIDEIASFDDTLLMLEEHVASSGSITLATASNSQETIMSEYNQADLDAAVATATATGVEQGLTQGAEVEHTRVTAILNHEKSAANFAQAKNAIETGLTVDQATGVLASMPDAPKAGSAFFDHMAGVDNPDVNADGSESGGELTSDQLADLAFA